MLNHFGAFHPLFAYYPRTALQGTQETLIEVYAPTGQLAEWTPGVGMSDTTTTLVWRGHGRVQPNIDWRARDRDFAGELTATHAVRVQLGINKNHVGAVLDGAGKIVTYGDDPTFAKDFIVKVVETQVSGAQGLVGLPMVVRNALVSDMPWVYNLLCDAGTR